MMLAWFPGYRVDDVQPGERGDDANAGLVARLKRSAALVLWKAMSAPSRRCAGRLLPVMRRAPLGADALGGGRRRRGPRASAGSSGKAQVVVGGEVDDWPSVEDSAEHLLWCRERAEGARRAPRASIVESRARAAQ